MKAKAGREGQVGKVRAKFWEGIKSEPPPLQIARTAELSLCQVGGWLLGIKARRWGWILQQPGTVAELLKQ